MSEVKFNQFGFAILPISIKPKESLTLAPVLYKVDTGANYTTISSKRLFELIPCKRKLLFNQKEQSIHAIDETD